MNKITVINEWIKGIEVEVGKRYTVSDEFFHKVTGEVVKISDKYVITEDDVTDIYDELNITMLVDGLNNKLDLIIEDIDYIV